MKPLLAYPTLVALPLAGLVGVLHAGSALKAPPAISGEWRVESPRAQTLTLSQSGIHVSLAFAGSEYRGELRGDTIVAESRERRAAGACVFLRARVDTLAVPHRMTVAMEPAARPECAGPFTAVHAGRAAKRGER
jgi:hypothetical protein